MRTTPPIKRRAAAILAAILLLAAGCSNDGSDSSSGSESTSVSSDGTAGASTSSSNVVFDASQIHTIDVSFDPAEYDALIEAYASDSSKKWIEATVTIDGSRYQSAGMRLKGNSSLMALGGAGPAGFPGGTGGEISAEDPGGLPWLIRLDKYVDDQNHEGVADFVVRSNSSETSLNEAIALELLAEAGLASQDAIAVRFSVNNGSARLRLVIENPDDVWMADNFDSSDALYKAESTGDYSFRGTDQAAYDEVFDQEAGKDNTDLAPLIEFLDFINNADDDMFAAELEDHLDIDAFATYLAMQDVVQNFDDIDGPGNNSYLHWDSTTDQFTVVPWDYNLAFGGGGFGPGGIPGDLDAANLPEGFGPPEGFDPANLPEGFGPPEGFDPENLPEGFDPAAGDGLGVRPGGDGFGGGVLGGSNVLVERFLGIESFSSLRDSKLTSLTSSLIGSGRAEEILDSWVDLLKADAGDLVDAETVDKEADQLRSAFEVR